MRSLYLVAGAGAAVAILKCPFKGRLDLRLTLCGLTRGFLRETFGANGGHGRGRPHSALPTPTQRFFSLQGKRMRAHIRSARQNRV